MKKTLGISLVLVLAILLSSCQAAIGALGGYTKEQYDAQATQIASLTAQNGTLTTDNGNLTSKNGTLTAQITSLTSEKADLDNQVRQLNQAKTDLQASIGKYQKMVCADHKWADIEKTGVWFLSDTNPNLKSVETDAKVKFMATQWLPAGNPVDTSVGVWLLTVDYFNGIALDSAHACVILDPAKWPDIVGQTANGS